MSLTYKEAEKEIRLLGTGIYIDLEDPTSICIDGRLSYTELRRAMQLIEKVQWASDQSDVQGAKGVV